VLVLLLSVPPKAAFNILTNASWSCQVWRFSFLGSLIKSFRGGIRFARCKAADIQAFSRARLLSRSIVLLNASKMKLSSAGVRLQNSSRSTPASKALTINPSQSQSLERVTFFFRSLPRWIPEDLPRERRGQMHG
jgi:hypothetical protein